MASGRALAMNRSEVTKLFDKQGRVIGGAVVGLNAGDIISEIALAIEMGCDAEDCAHYTSPSDAVRVRDDDSGGVEGTITDLYIPKKK